MAVKKIKISRTKRANHLKGKKKVSKVTKQKQSENILRKSTNRPSSSKPPKKKDKKKGNFQPLPFQDSDDDETRLENIQDIMDDQDDSTAMEFSEIPTKRSRKRNYNKTEDPKKSIALESEYTAQQYKAKTSKKMVVDLLPIKAKGGEIITRSTEVDYIPIALQDAEEVEAEDDDDEKDEEIEDSDEDILHDAGGRNDDDEESKGKVISTADLLIRREQEVERQKYRIGIICSGILEKPEDKMKNFKALFDLMEEHGENGSKNLFSVRKLAIISIAEVFKDILPEYRVGQVDTKMTTVRKATLQRITFETALLQQFKKYLQKTERIVSCISKKGGPKSTPENIRLAEVTVGCLCEILNAHPYFNYVQNVAQLLVFLLNCRNKTVRETVNKCFQELFSTDQKLDMSLYVIRRINHLIKKKSNNVHVEMITCFMALRIKEINLDAEKEKELKEKKLESHRQRVLNLSKKERKRKKVLAKLNKELEETRATENKETKQYKLTEIVKMVFTVYFRILKKDPNSKLLSACLEGLAKFAHVINVDFFSDLIEILNGLLESEELGYREQLHCIQTIFAILSGQGEALTIDPIRFYVHLYKNLFVVHAGKNHDDFLIILRTLHSVLIRRWKHISNHRLAAFIKRLLILSLNLLHYGTLANLGVAKILMQCVKPLDVLLDTDTTLGSGRYDPEMDDPEYCNAMCTSLFELAALQRHYHPTVRQIARYIALGVPPSGEGTLPLEIAKLSPEELFTQFDSSKVAFNPMIPTPQSTQPKVQRGRHIYLDNSLKRHCHETMQDQRGDNRLIDFRQSFREVFEK